MSMLNQAAFVQKALLTLESFDRKRRDRREFAPSQFAPQMTERDWWDALVRHAMEESVDTRDRPPPQPYERTVPAQHSPKPFAIGPRPPRR